MGIYPEEATRFTVVEDRTYENIMFIVYGNNGADNKERLKSFLTLEAAIAYIRALKDDGFNTDGRKIVHAE
jgi:hypothetical protein